MDTNMIYVMHCVPSECVNEKIRVYDDDDDDNVCTVHWSHCVQHKINAKQTSMISGVCCWMKPIAWFTFVHL